MNRCRGIVALGLAASMTVAGCGARWTEDQQAAVAARGEGSSAVSPTDGGDGATDLDAGAVTTIAGGGTGGADGGTTGGAGSTTGGTGGTGGTSGGSTGGSGGAKPCAAKSSAPGVTDGEIRVGSISSLSGPSPGLGASGAAGVRAYVAYRNANGGVCGRKLVLKEADDGTDAGRYRTIIASMAKEELGVVGGFTIGDIGGADLIGAAHLPVVNVPSSDNGAKVASIFDVNPPYANLDAAIGKYKFLYAQGVRSASVTYLAVEQSRLEAQNQQRLMKAAGIKVTQVQELPLATLSFDSAARGVVNSKADYLMYIGDSSSNVKMARALQDAGAKLKITEYFVYVYATSFPQAAGAAAEGATTWLRSLPNEDAGKNPELAAYVQWMGRAAPGETVDAFAADAWASAKAFFDGLESLKGPISRDALVTQLRSVGRYDAGGMIGPISFTAKKTTGCVVGLQLHGGKWRRLAPASGFLC